MVRKTIGACAGVLAALVFALSAFAADLPDSAHWHWAKISSNSIIDPTINESGWFSYCTAANWTVGTTGLNPENRWPGANDIIYYGNDYSDIQAFDMGGNSVTIYGIDDSYTRLYTAQGEKRTTDLWGYHNFCVRNGSLTINNCCTNTRAHFNPWSGGSIIVSDTCKSRMGFGGAEQRWQIHSGGFGRLAGDVEYNTMFFEVQAGGSGEIECTRLQKTSGYSSHIHNYGTLSFPSGLAFSGTVSGGSTTISQNDGTLTIGGNLSKASAGYGANIYFNGGVVDFTENSTLSGYAVAIISNAAPVTVNVASGKTADYRLLDLLSGAQLTKTGAGVFIVGTGSPATVNVTDGTLGVAGALDFGSGLTLASGTTLRIYGSGCSATAITGLSGATIDIVSDLSDGTKVFSSSNASLLTSVLAKLQASSGTLGDFSIIDDYILFSRSHAPSVFYWKGPSSVSPWPAFNDADNWGVGVTKEATNPNHLVPGASDWIHYMYDYAFTWYWDLGGMTHTIKGFDFTDWESKGSKWGFHNFHLKNGTLEITQNFTNQRITVSLDANAKFILGPNSHTRLSQGDAQSWYTVHDGCEMVMGGYLEIVIPMIDIYEGGTFSFEPKELTASSDSFKTSDGHPNPYLRNFGVANFPNGLNYLKGGSKSIPGTFTIDNFGGTMTFGGAVTKGSAAYGVFNLLFNGGTVVFNQSADLQWFANAGSTNVNATTTVQVANGQTVKLPGGTYADGSTIVKSGGGALYFGGALPANLQVTAGSICLEGSGATIDKLSMTSGTTLTIAGVGTTINTFTGYNAINFEVDVTKVSVGSVVLKSSNDTMLTALKSRAVLSEGYYLEKASGRLTLANDSVGYIFKCLGEKPMSDPTGWTSGTVAPAGADVFVKGDSTVAVLDDTMNVYKSITIMDSGALKMKNLKSVPDLRLLYNSKAIVAEGTNFVFNAGQLTCEMEPTMIPVFEISSGARATFATGTEFKNMTFVLLGTISCTPPFFFGTAAAGETTYFNFAATNGVIDVTKDGGAKIVYWAAPQVASGRVISPLGISLKGVTFIPKGTLFANDIAFYNGSIQNPVDEKFDFILDGTHLPITYNNDNRIAGGVRIKAFNGGAVEKSPDWITAPGVYGNPFFQGLAQFTFEGANSWFGYYYNRYTPHMNPEEDGFNQMTFRDGASFRVHHFNYDCNGKSVFTFENAFFDVLELPDYDRAMWGGWVWRDSKWTWQADNGGGYDIPKGVIDHSDLCKTNYFTPAFRGLKEVVIPSGTKLGFRGVNWRGIAVREYPPNSATDPASAKKVAYSNEWDRVILTDRKTPITGGGSIYVCNTVSNQSMTAIVCGTNNAATGKAWAEEDTIGNGNRLLFADGANWAGTVVSNGRLGLTNLTEAAGAACVRFNNLSFESPMDFRVWKGDAGQTNDCVTILSSAFAPVAGCINPVVMGGTPKVGDTFIIAVLPSGVPSMSGRTYLANKRWILVDEVDEDLVRRLKLRYVPGGILLNFRGAPSPES